MASTAETETPVPALETVVSMDHSLDASFSSGLAAVAAAVHAANTSNHVYIKSTEHAWMPAKLLETNAEEKTALVQVSIYKDEQSILSDGGGSGSGRRPSSTQPRRTEKKTILLSEYPNQALLLQNVNEKGELIEVEDMVDLPFLHEAAILYNLKVRHMHGKPYTRTGDIVIACNPYQWFDHLYSEETRNLYSDTLVWDTQQQHHSNHDARADLTPHIYEASALAYRGLACEGQDQSILVSGESGAGKTESVKICLNHIASVQQQRLRGNMGQSSPKRGGGKPKLTSSNKNAKAATIPELSAAKQFESPIVQRVLDSNPLLEAFGNAKTIRNDNSSRFGKYIQLQFDAEDPLDAALQGRVVPSCILAGSKCEVYLLEKSRVVMHEEKERTYHIFYQLLAADEELKCSFWEGLADTDNESFLYVGYTDTDTIEGQSDAARFQFTLDSLALVGIEGDSLRTLMRSICIVLQLGNLIFEEDPDDDRKTVITSVDELNALAELMGISPEVLTAALTIRTIVARNEEFKVPLNAVQAKDSCDAFAKEIYAKTFLWLVRAINDATCAERNYKRDPATSSRRLRSDYGTIGLLDIFGFESFEKNRFEQLCINYANEKLQQKFTQDIFRSVQQEYEFEGIELEEITYDDNTDVLDLVEGRMGLLAFLNEECVRPGGNDKGFVSKAHAMNKDSPCFVRGKHFEDTMFGIKHYAGLVVYDANGFVTKNMDTLPSDLQDCATLSSNEILAKELCNNSVMTEDETPSTSAAAPAAAAATKAKKKPPAKRPPGKAGASANTTAAVAPTTSGAGMLPSSGSANTAKEALLKKKGSNLVGLTVWTQFKNQLTTLMSTLSMTRTRYIRCIKPNQLKVPRIMQHWTTIEQLRCAGVVAAVTISRSAFPNRLEHEIVLDRFKSLWKKGEHAAVTDYADDNFDDDDDSRTRYLVDALLTSALQSMAVPKNDSPDDVIKAFVIGKTRAYFRAGALEHLEAERLKGLSLWTIEIQKMVRKFLQRTYYLRMRWVAIRIQSLVREKIARRRFLILKRCSLAVQCWYRCIRAVRLRIELNRAYRATLIQNRWRMAVAITTLKKNRAAAVVVQGMVRGALQRPKFRLALHEKREEAKLENQVRALQRKLEEAEAKRVEAERIAEEKARRAIEEYQEKKEQQAAAEAAAAAAAAAAAEAAAAAAASAQEEPEGSIKSAAASEDRASFRSAKSRDEERRRQEEEEAQAREAAANQLSLQQQTLMDESGKMLEYLRKEVFKLRNQNTQMRADFDLLKENNQRLMDANASAGASFAALNQHAKQLTRTNEKLASDVQSYRQQIQKLSVTQVELKEELKMKQGTYVAEVHSRLQYQKALGKIVDMVQERCRDSRLVEDILEVADECEAESMAGPTAMRPSSNSMSAGVSRLSTTPSKAGVNSNNNNHDKNQPESSSGLISSIRNLSFW